MKNFHTKNLKSAEGFVWQYDDSGTWETYPAAVCQELEKLRIENSEGVYHLDASNGKLYKIHVGEMYQKNVKTGYKRDIQRRIDPRSSLTTSVQAEVVRGLAYSQSSHWEENGSSDVSLHKLDSKSTEYSMIEKLFSSTLSRKIVSIERVQNKSQFIHFVTYLRGLQKEFSGDQRKDQKWNAGDHFRLLFHGSGADIIDKLVTSRVGFSQTYSGIGVHVYGLGTYFARDASYSDGYSRRMSNGCKKMIAAFVAVGRYAEGESEMPSPPEGFDSLCNDTKDPSIFVAEHASHCYPAYVITYRKYHSDGQSDSDSSS